MYVAGFPCMPGTVVGIWHWAHLTPTITLWGWCYYFPILQKRVLRHRKMRPISQVTGQKAAKPRFELRMSAFRICLYKHYSLPFIQFFTHSSHSLKTGTSILSITFLSNLEHSNLDIVIQNSAVVPNSSLELNWPLEIPSCPDPRLSLAYWYGLTPPFSIL